jgi:hypothetical protein
MCISKAVRADFEAVRQADVRRDFAAIRLAQRVRADARATGVLPTPAESPAPARDRFRLIPQYR